MQTNIIAIVLISICVLIEAQNVDQNSDDLTPAPKPFRRGFPVRSRNPVNTFVQRVGERVSDGTNRFKTSVQNILSEVRNRSQLAEKKAKDQIKELRTHAIDTLTRLKTLDAQVLQLEKYLKEVNQTFLDTKQELRNELTNQKTVIDTHIESTGTEKSTELEEESKKLDKKINEVDNLKLVPQTRGLGDGFGRHLK